MRKRQLVSVAFAVATLVTIILGVQALVQNSRFVEEPPATIYVTSSPVATISPSDVLPTLVPTRPPVPPPSERFDSFHELWFKFASLNEDDILALYSLRLSDYRFPGDFPFTIRDNAIYLKVQVDDKTHYLKTSFNQETLQQFCTPNDSASKLLCTVGSGRGYEGDLGISDADRDTLLAKAGSEGAESEMLKQISHAHLNKQYFVLNTDQKDVYILPVKDGYGPSFRTICSWYNDSRIACHQVGGTVAWQMRLFDLTAEHYVELPHGGHNLAVFEKYYLDYNGYQTYTLYNLQNNALRSRFRSLTRLLSDDAVAFVGPCTDGPWDFSEPISDSICFRYLETDGQDITRETKLNLSSYDSEDCYWASANEEGIPTVNFAVTSLHRTPRMYLVVACDKAFFIPVDDLQIAQVVDLALDEYGDVVYRYDNLVLTQRVSGGNWPDFNYQTTVFDLDQCEGVLDETCIYKAWEGSVVQSQAVRGWGERYYRSSPSDSSLIYVAGRGQLRIYDLDTQQEVILEGQLLGVSEDGTTVLIEDESYHYLFDLENWRLTDTEIVPEHLIIARDWI
jgi:hypothetical protein